MSFFFKQGTEGFEQQINKCLELSEYLYQKVSNREDFAIVFKGERSVSQHSSKWEQSHHIQVTSECIICNNTAKTVFLQYLTISQRTNNPMTVLLGPIA